MLEFAKTIPFTFAALFPVLNPLGGAVTFLTLAMGFPEKELRTLAFKVAVNAFILLTVVLITGSWVLRFFGITLPIVRVAGGMVVAYIAWGLLTRPNALHTQQSTNMTNKDPNDIAFFPLTMPTTAGPGSIAVTLTVGAHQFSKSITETVLSQLGGIIGILLACITVFICYRYAYFITRSIGKNGTHAIMRISAFINLCIGIQIVWTGINALLQQ